MRYNINTPTWWIAHHGERVAHGYCEDGEVIANDIMSWETFDNEAEWKARLLELGVEIEEENDN